MSDNYNKFRTLLKELFQLDQADLDFGIYRIMNLKRDEIVKFLEEELLPQVREAFSKVVSSDKGELEAELNRLKNTLKDAGVDPETSPKLKELKQKINETLSLDLLENEVFGHLFNFFRRYYSEGDFLSLPRYKKGV